MAVPHHVLQTEPLPFLVQAGRVERSAVPADHVRVLLVPRIEDLLQEVYEAIRAADILWRTPWVIAAKLQGSHITDLQKPWRRIRARNWRTYEFTTSVIHLPPRR